MGESINLIRDISPSVFELGNASMEVARFTSRSLYPGDSNVVTIKSEAVWVSEQVWTLEEKRFFTLSRIETRFRGCAVYSLVTVIFMAFWQGSAKN
jgi:hypothetical protein